MSIFLKLNNHRSSRRQIQIQGVDDNVLMLPGNEYRLIAELSSVNFELKSDAEQDAIIDSYQGFLNSLSFPLQLVSRIREIDVTRYLGSFREGAEIEPDDVYRAQIKSYVQFVESLVTANKILSRRFYAVMAYHDERDSGATVAREQLMLRSDIVHKGLARIGVATRILPGLEVLDLFYSFYSPEQSKRQPLTEQTMQLLKSHYL